MVLARMGSGRHLVHWLRDIRSRIDIFVARGRTDQAAGARDGNDTSVNLRRDKGNAFCTGVGFPDCPSRRGYERGNGAR
jgi:hypothetical protein